MGTDIARGLEPARIIDRCLEAECRDFANAGYGHQASADWILPRVHFDPMIQLDECRQQHLVSIKHRQQGV